MAKRRARTVNRTATRREHPQVVADPPGPPTVPDLDLAAIEAELVASGAPEDVVAAARALADPESGLEALLAEISAVALKDIAACRRPLDVETAVCSLLEMIARGAPESAAPEERALVQEMMLFQLAEVFAATGGEPGLAGLRALAAIGPLAVRSRAAGHAAQLAASGLPEPRWAGTIGRPEFVRAWRYGDIYGEQTSVGLLFEHGGREHGLLVLIDHLLGGGVKDCFLVEGRAAAQLRQRAHESLEDNPEAIFEDVDAADAAGTLCAALAERPCPVQDDQVEDVGRYLHLLRSRTALLAERAGLPEPAEVATHAPGEPVEPGELEGAGPA